MLKVEIHLVPGGFEPLRRTIASMSIANISDLADVSDYRVKVWEDGNPLTGEPPHTVICEVAGHDRRQSVWALLAKAAETALAAHRREQ